MKAPHSNCYLRQLCLSPHTHCRHMYFGMEKITFIPLCAAAAVLGSSFYRLLLPAFVRTHTRREAIGFSLIFEFVVILIFFLKCYCLNNSAGTTRDKVNRFVAFKQEQEQYKRKRKNKQNLLAKQISNFNFLNSLSYIYHVYRS